MINENNNAVEIEIFLILFFFSASFNFFFFLIAPLSPLALTVHVRCDLWVIVGHHLF